MNAEIKNYLNNLRFGEVWIGRMPPSFHRKFLAPVFRCLKKN